MQLFSRLGRASSVFLMNHFGRPMEMFDVDPSRKHFVPRFYLRGFQPQRYPGRVYTFDKHSPDKGIRRRRIENVEVSNHAYSVGIDNILRRQERVLADILSEFRSTEVETLNSLIADREKSARLRRWLAYFVVTSALRSRAYRELIAQETREIYSEYHRKMTALLQTFLEERELVDRIASHGFAPQEYAAMLESALHLDSYRKWVATHIQPFIRTEEGRSLYRAYAKGTWRFYECTDDRTFITSDLPSLLPSLGPNLQEGDVGWFTMPLSSKLLLKGRVGEAPEGDSMAPMLDVFTAADVDSQNQAMYESSHRLIYSATELEIERLLIAP